MRREFSATGPAEPFWRAAEAKGADTLEIIERALRAALFVGGLAALAYAPLAGWLLNLSDLWRDYVPFAGNIPLWTLRSAKGAAIGAFMGCEQAAGRFHYLLYLVPCVAVESVVLFFFTDLASVIRWLVAIEVVELALIFGVIRRRRRRICMV